MLRYHRQRRKLLGDLRCNAEAPGGVFAVGDGQFDVVLFLQLGQSLVDDGSPGTAKNVTDEENAHGGSSSRLDGKGSEIRW